MAKYYRIIANPSFIGATGTWKIACNENEIDSIAHEVGIDHIETYENPSEYEEENGVAYEYDIYYEEITKEEFENSEDDLI